MSSTSCLNIAVIGAGIIGVNTAYKLQGKNLSITLFDEHDPGSQTSMGNAGTFANYACIPINSNDIFLNLPFLLFSNNSPLSFQWSKILNNFPWLLKFLINCKKENVIKITNTLAFLLKNSLESNNKLIKKLNLFNLINNNEVLYLYENEIDYFKDKKNLELREKFNIKFQYLNSDEIKDLEPNLIKQFYKGVLFENSKSTINPKKYTEKIFYEFLKNNGKFKKEKIINIVNNNNKLKLVTKGTYRQDFDKIIICAGAQSGLLLKNFSDFFNIVSERGYHLMYQNYEGIIKRPIGIGKQGFYYTPMDEGLRAAGTVEIGTVNNEINKSRIKWMQNKVKETFDIKELPNKVWLGFRPTLPDSLPVIGKSKNNPNIIYNFGHQHLGLTLASYSAEIIEKIIFNQEIEKELSFINPNRFN
tara:strand:- start:1002 stop:2252 length:1251 start_codon:yes stop_codon:yes gene_type:complete